MNDSSWIWLYSMYLMWKNRNTRNCSMRSRYNSYKVKQYNLLDILYSYVLSLRYNNNRINMYVIICTTVDMCFLIISELLVLVRTRHLNEIFSSTKLFQAFRAVPKIGLWWVSAKLLTIGHTISVPLLYCIVLYWGVALTRPLSSTGGVIVRFVLTNVYLRYHFSEPICME